ncbi:MAG: radical SAM protein [Bacteroidales bacterium]|nr:radical SAM protein [Bacteroidales bacterium]
MIDLSQYMTESIRSIMTRAYLGVLGNPREARFVHRMQQTFANSEKRREETLKKEGLEVPPFLIASIATDCNLHCKGCYARSNGLAANPGQSKKQTLTPNQWHAIFEEAASMGVNFALLAGGEPLTRRDLLEQIASVEDMIFPVFTNGTMVGATYMEFFKEHLNMVPVISLEGDGTATDDRRGRGVYQRVMMSMQMLKEAHLFFGTSITVTSENYRKVTTAEYMAQLKELGCRLVFLVEYVPLDESTTHLTLNDTQIAELEQIVEQRREDTKGLIVLSFPGDEKALDGCLAAGRGFFHIGPDGAAEPCPFASYSDSNVAEMGLRKALSSPLFRSIRAAKALGWEHTGGCTLYEHRDEIAAMLQ